MLFGKPSSWWQQQGAEHTAQEIAQQPGSWLKTEELIRSQSADIQNFLSGIISHPDYSIVLTGAGTSEFIGNALVPFLSQEYRGKIRSIASTDLTTTPHSWIYEEIPTLLTSFGRSGNSPESLGAIEAAGACSSKLCHLLITCNESGALAKMDGRDDSRALLLPEETHDLSFAMTSSFTSMYLAALLTFSKKDRTESFKDVCSRTERFLQETYPAVKSLSENDGFDRIVFLGSGGLKGFAQEAALKMCELTQGRVDTCFDTPLGFRHGPKSVINDKTLTVFFLSQDPYIHQYEMDLLREMAAQKKKNRIAVFSVKPDTEAEKLADFFFSFGNQIPSDDTLAGLEYIAAAQVMALFKSLSLDISPDNPCPSGEVNRVVQGVTIYPYKKGESAW